MLRLTTLPGADAPRVVWLFGVGLIGRAVRRHLWRLTPQVDAQPFDWQDQDLRRRHQANLLEINQHGDRGALHSFVWAAGSGHFLCSDEDLQAERRAFDDFLDLLQRAVECGVARPAQIHYLSSAGGLFEGQRQVTPASRPAPQRPYGQMKLEQEQQLRERFPDEAVHLYRPSSVYGVRPGRVYGKGLVDTLIRNARTGQETTLDARLVALRDYVSADDVGRDVVRCVERGGAAGEASVRTLVTGRSASIFEIKAQVEKLTRRPVRYRLDASFGNSSDITFSPAVKPGGWQPAGLEVGIRRVLNEIASTVPA